MSGRAPQRRSTRLLAKTCNEPVTRSSRRLVTLPLSSSSSESDDSSDSVIYMPPPQPPTIDLTERAGAAKARTPVKKKSPFKCHETPPKQRKSSNDENTTPSLTPSVLLERLSLCTDEKGKGNRRQLFKEDDPYTNARKALHSTYQTNLPGREKELEELRGFIMRHLDMNTSSSLYVSGPPGTGKTASLNYILQQEQVARRIKDVYVNCTSIKSSGSIFSRIAKELEIKISGKGEKDCVAGLENYLRKKNSRRTILLVLDEIDQLESKNQSVLYTIFEWPSIPNSRLILIGIANALDLTDRILPRLQARCELKPELMHFAPYTKSQIVEIFTNRLQTAGVLHLFTPVALQMLAGKVAAVSGDVRRALDIGRRVVEKIDSNKSVLNSVENLDHEDNKTVELKDVISILNNVYGTSQHLDDEIEDYFPLQQKIIVCSLLLILKKAKNKDVTVGRLHEIYRKVSSKRNIQPVDQGEFVGLCSLIETRGIIKIITKKDPRMNKISLVWDEEEVGGALKDKQLLSTILQDDGCLGKL